MPQHPLDILGAVLAQWGNRVQHALRAFAPRDQWAVKSAADTRRTRTSDGEQLARSAASSIGREVGRQVIRGVLGGSFGESGK